MNGIQRGNETIGSLVRIMGVGDQERVGHCWMAGRLRVGEVVQVLQHAGDYFYNYALVRVYGDSIQLEPGVRFGAYSLGTPLKWQPNREQADDLMKGESVRTEAVAQEVASYAETDAAEAFEAVCAATEGAVLRIGRNPAALRQGVQGLYGTVVVNTMEHQMSDHRGILVAFSNKAVFVKPEVLRCATVIQFAMENVLQPHKF